MTGVNQSTYPPFVTLSYLSRGLSVYLGVYTTIVQGKGTQYTSVTRSGYQMYDVHFRCPFQNFELEGSRSGSSKQVYV